MYTIRKGTSADLDACERRPRPTPTYIVRRQLASALPLRI